MTSEIDDCSGANWRWLQESRTYQDYKHDGQPNSFSKSSQQNQQHLRNGAFIRDKQLRVGSDSATNTSIQSMTLSPSQKSLTPNFQKSTAASKAQTAVSRSSWISRQQQSQSQSKTQSKPFYNNQSSDQQQLNEVQRRQQHRQHQRLSQMQKWESNQRQLQQQQQEQYLSHMNNSHTDQNVNQQIYESNKLGYSEIQQNSNRYQNCSTNFKSNAAVFYRNFAQQIERLKVCVCANSSLLARERCKLLQEVRATANEFKTIFEKEACVSENLEFLQDKVNLVQSCEEEKENADFQLQDLKKQIEKECKVIREKTEPEYADAVHKINRKKADTNDLRDRILLKEKALVQNHSNSLTKSSETNNPCSQYFKNDQNNNSESATQLLLRKKRDCLRQEVDDLKQETEKIEELVTSGSVHTITARIEKMQADADHQTVSVLEKRSKLLPKRSEFQKTLQLVSQYEKQLKDFKFQYAVLSEQKRILDAKLGNPKIREKLRKMKKDIEDQRDNRENVIEKEINSRQKSMNELTASHEKAETDLILETRKLDDLREKTTGCNPVFGSCSNGLNSSNIGLANDELELKTVTIEFNIESLKETCNILEAALAQFQAQSS